MRYLGAIALAAEGRSVAGSSREPIDLGSADMMRGVAGWRVEAHHDDRVSVRGPTTPSPSR